MTRQPHCRELEKNPDLQAGCVSGIPICREDTWGMKMKIYVFSEDSHLLKSPYGLEAIRTVLEKVAATTDVRELVVAVYLRSCSTIWGGEHVVEWLEPESLCRRAGRDWSFVRSFEPPTDLPQRFKLIRMVFGTSARYPKTTVDGYGWKERFERFEDHLANLFAHELHHYRRHHLGLHPGEGEQSACRWGVARAQEAGFSVRAVRVRRRRLQTQKEIRIPSRQNPLLVRRAKSMLSHLSVQDLEEVTAWIEQRSSHLEAQAQRRKMQDDYERLRALPDGARVRILRDNVRPSAYVGQIAIKIGTLRRNSRRLAIRTSDGETWHWPMAWLEPVDQSVESAQSAREALA